MSGPTFAASGAGETGAHPRSVEIHIEELLLEGVSPADRHAAGDALERELGLLLQAHGPSLLTALDPSINMSANGEVRISPADAPAASFPLEPPASPEALGRQAARGVFNSLLSSIGERPSAHGSGVVTAKGSTALGRKEKG